MCLAGEALPVSIDTGLKNSSKCIKETEMNAADFYEHFKEALKYLGLSWGEMDQAVVAITDGKFTMTAAGKSCTLELK